MKKAPVSFYLCLLLSLFLGMVPARSSDLGRFDTVVIDAGHGGHDRGGIPGQRVPEKVMNLDVSLRLQRSLRKLGFRTVMTRSSDVFIPLSGRVAAANARSRNIFVCIHFNSSGENPDAHGIETYFYHSGSLPLAQEIHRRLMGIASMNRGIKQRGYYVLRNTRVPAVLVECGFLTNRGDISLASQANYRQRLADQIAAAIATTKRNH